jgi:hypothetical protein
MNTSLNDPEMLLEFQPIDEAAAEQLTKEFSKEEILRSSGFDGTVIITIITAAIPVLNIAFKFYKEHKASLKAAKIKIKNKEVSFEGFTADEINEMVERGSIQKIQERLK